MTWPREKITEVLMYQCKNLGFLALTNITGFDEAELFRLTKWFFSLPESVKKTLHQKHHNSENPNYYRGLAPFLPNDPSLKELYDYGEDY